MKNYLITALATAVALSACNSDTASEPAQGSDPQGPSHSGPSLSNFPYLISDLMFNGQVIAEIASAADPVDVCHYSAGQLKDCSEFATQNHTEVYTRPYVKDGEVAVMEYDQTTVSLSSEQTKITVTENFVLGGVTQATYLIEARVENIRNKVDLQDTMIWGALQCDNVTDCEIPAEFDSQQLFGHGSQQVTADFLATYDNSFSLWANQSSSQGIDSVWVTCTGNVECVIDLATGNVTGIKDNPLGSVTLSKSTPAQGYVAYKVAQSSLLDTSHIAIKNGKSAYLFNNWQSTSTKNLGSVIMFNQTAFDDVERYFQGQ